MQYQFINNNSGEIYTKSSILLNEDERAEERYNFWKMMDLIALQNMSVLGRKL